MDSFLRWTKPFPRALMTPDPLHSSTMAQLKVVISAQPDAGALLFSLSSARRDHLVPELEIMW
jgi:hypothetical protein